jgi:hypothetical protein
LKAVDDAIQQYEKNKSEKDLWRIKNAFEDWKREQGIGWESSVRNRARAVTNLNSALDKAADYRTYQITHFTIPELVALSVVAKERKKAIIKIFEGKEVNFKAAKTEGPVKAGGAKGKGQSRRGRRLSCDQRQDQSTQDFRPPCIRGRAPEDGRYGDDHVQCRRP